MQPLLPLAPGSLRTRLLVAGLALALFAATLGAVLFASDASRILNRSGLRILESVEERAAAEDGEHSLGKSPSPFITWMAALFLAGDEPEAVPVVRALDALSLALLAVLLYLFSTLLVGPFSALLAPLLLLLQPQVFQCLAENTAGLSLTALLAPALLLGLALTRSAPWARIALCALAGLAGGLALFTHHLGLWTTVAATLALFMAGRSRVRGGQFSLAPLGLELVTVLALFAIAAGSFYKLSSLEGKEVLDFLFGPFKPFHPPFAVAGTVYREVVDGGPPWWTTVYLWLVRTPLSLGVIAAFGVSFALRGRTRFPSLLWLPLGPLLAILVVTAGAGSPLYSGTLNLLAPLALAPALLATLLFAPSRGQEPGPTWPRFVQPSLAVVVVAHLALIAIHHFPHPSAYANFIGGGSGSSLSGRNGLYVQPTLDREAAQELLSRGKKVVLSPWGNGATPILKRYAKELGLPAPKVRPGGALPALLHAGGSDATGRLLLNYCKGPDVAASLTIDNQILWCVIDPGAAP